jgi:hypothetical protein
MADFLANYSIQKWLESCPQGYLEDTVYGHGPEEIEPAELLQNDDYREQQIRTTVQLIAGERCALAASSGLVTPRPIKRARPSWRRKRSTKAATSRSSPSVFTT